MATKKGNRIEIQGDIAVIYTSNGATTIIDTEDLKLLEGRAVGYDKSNDYFYIHKERKRVYLHRLIKNTPKGLEADHINWDKSDNRKSNLRNCTKQDNILSRKNTIETENHIRGISYNKRHNNWQVVINKEKYIGVFKSRGEAIKAKELAEKNYKETHTIDSKAIKPLAIKSIDYGAKIQYQGE